MSNTDKPSPKPPNMPFGRKLIRIAKDDGVSMDWLILRAVKVHVQ